LSHAIFQSVNAYFVNRPINPAILQPTNFPLIVSFNIYPKRLSCGKLKTENGASHYLFLIKSRDETIKKTINLRRSQPHIFA